MLLLCALPDDPVDDTSEEEDFTETDPDFKSKEEDSDEEGPATYTSRNGEILWSSSPPLQTQGRARAEQVLRRTPGPTRYACAQVKDIMSTFELFFTMSIQNILLEMTKRGDECLQRNGTNTE